MIKKYFGTGFVHVGVIFDRLLSNDILVIKKPLTIIRFGDGLWTNRAFQIWMLDWPKLIWSFNTLSFETKNLLTKKNPWKNPKSLLLMRALGNYNYEIYKKHILLRKISRKLKFILMTVSIIPRFILFVPAFLYISFFLPKNIYLIESLINSYRNNEA